MKSRRTEEQRKTNRIQYRIQVLASSPLPSDSSFFFVSFVSFFPVPFLFLPSDSFSCVPDIGWTGFMRALS